MPESGTYGSVRGAPSNGRPYRDQFELRSNRLACHGQRFALPLPPRLRKASLREIEETKSRTSKRYKATGQHR